MRWRPKKKDPAKDSGEFAAEISVEATMASIRSIADRIVEQAEDLLLEVGEMEQKIKDPGTSEDAQ